MIQLYCRYQYQKHKIISKNQKVKNNKQQKHEFNVQKRTYFELFGFSILALITYLQWDTIQIAIEAIKKSDGVYIWIAIGLYWLLLPLTAVSYRLLSDSRLIIWTTTLAQLAGSGPGRIIPGGLGRLSFSVIHLIKLGFSSARAIIVSVTSNIIGVIVNLSILAIIVFFEPDIKTLIDQDTLYNSSIALLIATLILISIFYWLMHAKRTRKSTLKLTRKWRIQIKSMIKEPALIFKLLGIALLTLIGNVGILLLCSRALGVDINASDALIALSVGVFIGSILPTPGGVGGVEAGIASTFVFLGFSPAEATSIALLFRAITYWQPLIPGTIAYFYLRKRKLL